MAAASASRPRILLVDDSSDDAELVQRALSRGGIPATLARVDDAASLRKALAGKSWDLLVADYSQPGFGALAVLAVLREVQEDLPCIVISGVAGEDRVVEMMRAGARDFVSKDRLQRLAPAVRRELEEATRRRVEVTRRRQLEVQLQQSQKMQAVGRLAGGVAHDFNNLLTAIIGYSQIASIRPDVPAPVLLDLKEITSAAHRAAALTRQLLAFSRRPVLEPKVLNLNTVVSGIEALLRRLIGEDIALATDLDVGVSAVLADPSQLEQVIRNLALNARDALPNGGRISLKTRMVDTPDRPLALATPATGRFVALEVTDNGVGMDENTSLQIFDPFFTTKELGTGLGLSTVYGIVQQSGGGIAVESATGKGTTIAIYLPVAAGDEAQLVLPETPIGPGGSETILVVEDDDRVRDLASRVLELAGYTVLEASEPEAAIERATTERNIDLLLADQVMPVMRGEELFAVLKRRRPALKVLYISGYRNEADFTEGDGKGAFLPKPFTPDILATAVRCVLDGTVGGSSPTELPGRTQQQRA